VIFLVFLSIPIEASPLLGLEAGETAGWILGLWALPGVIGLVLSIRYRVPIVMTGNLFVMILVLRVSSTYEWPDLVGAAILAGLLVLATSRWGLTERLNRWLPPAVIYGLLAGAVLPFMTDMFTMTADFPSVVSSAVITYLATRILAPNFPAILPAVLIAAVATALTGDLVIGSADVTLVTPMLTAPTFDLPTILAVTPVIVILITIQSNVPAMVFLREQGYEVDADQITLISGLGTLVGSLLGPIGLSLSLP
jgi:benzoate membrane transport protein